MSGKILIIDPNAHRRSALCQAIQNSLYSCISAKDIETADYSGVEGVLLSTHAPDTLNTIRAQLHDANCPILILCHQTHSMIGPIIFAQVRQMLLRQPAICAKSYRGCALQCAAPQQPAKLRCVRAPPAH